MLTMRPKPRSIMPSTVALISSMGVSMLALSATIQSSHVHWRKSPGLGPAALVTRMSGAGQASRTSARPCTVVTSAATVHTCTPVASRMSLAVASSACAPRATMVSDAPSSASANAHARPSPLLAAQTSAVLPLIPRSMETSCFR
ncbi:hypothetical protein D3C72_1916370 [compost metagenome]